jgi:hypothetical protein
MSNNKKKTPYSSAPKRKSYGEIQEDSFDTELEKTIEHILANIGIGGETITQLNEIVWKNLCSGAGIKICYRCPLCFEVYSSPQFEPICLPCGHTFCRPCLHKLQNSLWSGNCPFDSSEFYFLEDLLPVNYSLLDRSSDPSPNICPKHNSSILAYCSDDLELLCGKCLLLHSSHKILEISSEEAFKISQANFENFKKLEKQLKTLLTVWETYKERLVKNQKVFEQLLQKHVENLKIAEEELIQEIRNRTEKITSRIQGFKDVLRDLSTCNADQVIECIKLQIDCAETFAGIYTSLSDFEKLSMVFTLKREFPKIKKVIFKNLEEVDKVKFRRIIIPTG